VPRRRLQDMSDDELGRHLRRLTARWEQTLRQLGALREAAADALAVARASALADWCGRRRQSALEEVAFRRRYPGAGR